MGNRFILRNHLEDLWDGQPAELAPALAISHAIVDDPKRHLDALVEAGVLRSSVRQNLYEVTPPKCEHHYVLDPDAMFFPGRSLAVVWACDKCLERTGRRYDPPESES